ncbi:phage replication protein [Pseudomonas aeruginosa]|nr:phage replication protein [Pseudomonas aeruginosa]
MARSRNIKPGFFSNEHLVELDFATRLLFIGLWTEADREGRLEDRPRRLKMALFPADNVDMDRMLDDLDRLGFIKRYTVGDVKAIQIINWSKHQNPHVKEAKSIIPEMPEVDACKGKNEESTVQAPDSHSSFPADSLSLDSGFLIPDSNTPLPPKGECDSLFDQFWAVYPNKTCKAKARAKWEKLKVTPDLFNKIMAGLRKQCASQAWLKDGGQFVPHPTTWLNGERWNDEVRSNVHQLPSRHHGFADRDYTAGLIEREDGTYGF